jgi:UDP-3-O-[3-hydroxymyristoyl] glucosamine N-acyltransferase
MADSRFFHRSAPLSLARLAAIAEAELAGDADPDKEISDVAPLETAGPDDVAFLDNRKYVNAFAASRAGACIVHPDFAGRAPGGMALLLTAQPYKGYARVAQALYPVAPVQPGIAPTASVDPSARIDPSAEIGPGAVIGAGAEIGLRCRIGANAVVGPGVVLGDDTTVGPCASLSHCLVGRRVTIYSGVRIGQDGFGFAIDPKGHVRVPQLGRVLIEDDVEVGANATIDRGSGPDTVIGRGCMIDNLVQIGHNVEIGPGSIIVAQAGVAGSSKLGSFVAMAAQSGVAGHLKIGAGARIGAQCGVMRDVEPGVDLLGSPAMPVRQFWRLQVRLMRLIEEKGK